MSSNLENVIYLEYEYIKILSVLEEKEYSIQDISLCLMVTFTLKLLLDVT